MANPGSFAWFLEMFGYAAMGAATWLVAPAFRGSRRADAIRYLLVANGVLSIGGAACTALFDRWVFSTAGMVSFAAWNALIPVCYLLIATTRGGGFDESVEGLSHGPRSNSACHRFTGRARKDGFLSVRASLIRR